MEQKHFVVIRLGVLGDVALTTGVLHHLYQQFGYTFSIITRSPFNALFLHHPAVTTVHTLPYHLSFLQLLYQAYTIAKQYPSTPLIDLHGNIRSFIISYFWRSHTATYPKYSKERKAFLKSRDPYLSQLLFSTSVTQRYFLAFSQYLQPEYNLKELPSLQTLSPYLPLTDIEYQEACSKLSPPQEPIALHPYASHATKVWPESYWKTLIEMLQKKGYPLIILGKSNNTFTSESIPIEYNYTNRTTIRESMALLKASRLLITPDSGLLHLATGVQTPSIAFFGATTKEWGFFPPQPSLVLEDTTLRCRPCSLHGNHLCPYAMECMYNIEPEYVVSSVEKVLSGL